MDPFGFVKSAREAYNVTPWWISFPAIGISFLILLAVAGKAVQEIAGWRPKRWLVSMRHAVIAVVALAVRLQLRSPVFFRGPSHSNTPTAIAFPITVSMAYENGAVSVFCAIAIYALTRTKESPAEVALLLHNGDEVCRVEFHPGYQPQIVEPGAWRVMKYAGTIPAANLEKLTRAVRHTRTRVTVEVGLLIPGGSAGAAHYESGVQFWLPEVDGRGAPLAGSPGLTAIIDDWRRFETDHFKRANDLLEMGMSIANTILNYGRAADPLSHAPQLVQSDFVDKVEGWTENVRAFWARARESQ